MTAPALRDIASYTIRNGIHVADAAPSVAAELPTPSDFVIGVTVLGKPGDVNPNWTWPNAAKLAGVNDLTASHFRRSVLHKMILARA